jgi:hypothetical protein
LEKVFKPNVKRMMEIVHRNRDKIPILTTSMSRNNGPAALQAALSMELLPDFMNCLGTISVCYGERLERTYCEWVLARRCSCALWRIEHTHKGSRAVGRCATKKPQLPLLPTPLPIPPPLPLASPLPPSGRQATKRRCRRNHHHHCRLILVI